jgi:hypothetical protein
MRTSMMIVASLLTLSLAACAENESDYGGDSLPGPAVQKVICPTGCDKDLQHTLDNNQWIPLGGGAFANSLTTVPGFSQCAALPQTGQCAYACDPDAFRETLPIGTCAAIHCDFPDGGEVVLGGCH